MSSIADLRYSDVASYVGLVLHKNPAERRRTPQKGASRSVVSLLVPPPVRVSSPSKSGQHSRQPELPPIEASRAERLKAHLRLLKAEQNVQKERVKKLEVSLSDSKLVEKKARQRTAKHHEMHRHHRHRCLEVQKEIERLSGELGYIEQGLPPPPAAAASEAAPAEEAPEERASRDVPQPAPVADGSQEAPAAPEIVVREAPPEAPAATPGSGRRPGSSRGSEENSVAAQDAAAVPRGADAADGEAVEAAEGQSEDVAGEAAEGQSDAEDAAEGSATSDALGSEEDLSEEDAELGGTLRVEEPASEAPPAQAAAVTVKFGAAPVVEAAQEPSSEDEADMLAEYLQRVRGKSESELPKEDRAELARLRRDAIRALLIEKAGSARKAFAFIDLNGSGSISHQEFGEGVRRLGIDWPTLTGLKVERHFFRLFDTDHDHVITFRELFPKQAAEERAGMTRVPTPDFCRRYGREKTQVVRLAGWQPKNPEEKLSTLTSAVESQDEAARHKKWMQSTHRRLKGKGKSDARCRELVALHLPKGSGPRDRQGVHTFSAGDLRMVKQAYTDEWNQPYREATRTMVDLRDLRREQKQIIEKLYKVTEAEFARKQAEEKAATGLAGISLFGGAVAKALNKASESPTEAPPVSKVKGVDQIAKELGIDETQLTDIQGEFQKCTESNSKLGYKGFARLLKAIAPSRTLAESDLRAWWTQIVAEELERRLSVASKDSGMRSAQPQCDFEQFAVWYASCELRVRPPAEGSPSGA